MGGPTNFTYTIKYRPGTQNKNADALSMPPEPQQGAAPVCVDQVMAEQEVTWAEWQSRDSALSQIRQWKEQDLTQPEVCESPSSYLAQLLREWDKITLQNGVLMRRYQDVGSEGEISQVIIPKQESSGVWRAYHKRMGHPSGERTLAALRERCYWPRMTQDVKEWTGTCLQCVCGKAGPEVRAPLVPITTSYPFEVVGVDYLSLGCPNDCYPYILVMTDLFSK